VPRASHFIGRPPERQASDPARYSAHRVPKQWNAVMWGCVFGGVNLTMILKLLRERSEVTFSIDEMVSCSCRHANHLVLPCQVLFDRLTSGLRRLYRRNFFIGSSSHSTSRRYSTPSFSSTVRGTKPLREMWWCDAAARSITCCYCIRVRYVAAHCSLGCRAKLHSPESRHVSIHLCYLWNACRPKLSHMRAHGCIPTAAVRP
jgi:hypothetical protein